MGNVNEPANEKGPNVAEPPGALPDGQERSILDLAVPTNLDSENEFPPSSSSTQDESGSATLPSPVSPYSVNSQSTPVVITDSNDIQSSHDRSFDTSTQSSNTSFPISESALPTTFDISAEITFLDPGELSDYFVTPNLTHLGLADHPTLSDVPSLTTQPEQSLDPSHSRPSTLPLFFPARDALDSKRTSAMSHGSDAPAICEDVNQPLLNLEASDLSLASLVASAVHGSTSAVHKDTLIMQPSEVITEPTDSALHTPVLATDVSHQRPRENLVPIDNVVSVIADAVPTKSVSQKSRTHTDKDAILANIPLAATYAEAANLAAQYPEFTKELLSRPLLKSPRSRAPAVPAISYAAPDSTAQGARSRDHRRTRRGGARNGCSHSQSKSRPTRESEESRYMQDEYARGHRNVPHDDRKGRLALPPHLDREPPWHNRNTGDSTRTRWQDDPRAPGQAVSHEPKYYYASGEPTSADASHDLSTLKDEVLSRVPEHETSNINVSDRSNVDEWVPWLSGQENSQDRAVRENLDIPGETRRDAPDEWVHSYDPWVSGNQQSSSHIHGVSDTIRKKASSTQRPHADEWRPALDSSVPENVCTKPDRLPGSQSLILHNTASKSFAPDVTARRWQAPHDLWLIEQPVIGDTISRQYPVVRQECPVHIHSQPMTSTSSQSGRGNGKLDVNSHDPYRIVRQQQVGGITLATRQHLRNEPESGRRVSSADTGSARQMELHNAPRGEPRSVSSPPQIVACFSNEKPYKMTAPSSVNFSGAGSHDVPFRDLNIEPVSEPNLCTSKTMPTESRNPALNSKLCPSHATTRPGVNWLERDVTRDATPRSINPVRRSSMELLPSMSLASISQNDLPHVSQHPNSSNFCPSAETIVDLQLAFDPRAEGWPANPGGTERGPGVESYDTSLYPRHPLPARAKINRTFVPREMHQRGHEAEMMDLRKEQRLTDPDRHDYRMRPRGGSNFDKLRSATGDREGSWKYTDR